MASATYGAIIKFCSNTLVYHTPSSGLLFFIQSTKNAVISYSLPAYINYSPITCT